MRKPGKPVGALVLMGVALSFAACNHGPKTTSSAGVDGGKPTVSAAQAALSATVARNAAGSGNAAAATNPAAPTSSPSRPAQTVAGNGSAPKVVSSDRSQSLVVGPHTFRFVTHLERVEGTDEDTVVKWELRGANDRVVYQQSYPVTFQDGRFDSTVSVGADAFHTQQGGGILIHGMDLPSAPDSGGWLQVFGYKYGRDKYGVDESLFGPFGPPIFINGEFLGVETDGSSPGPVMSGGATLTVMHDVAKFKLKTGNVDIVYPVLINWITGQLQPGMTCTEMTSKGRVQRCTYAVMVEALREDQQTFVRLFPEPDDGFTAQHVVVQAASKIEYLEARASVSWNQDGNGISFGVDGDLWLKVRIDGKEGWIHTQEDFSAVGLPLVG
jgi:hypothetical protein